MKMHKCLPAAFRYGYICRRRHISSVKTVVKKVILLPEVVEVCELQGSVAVCEELTMTFVCHVTLNRFCRVERPALLVAP